MPDLPLLALRLLGWRASLLFGDPGVWARWRWARTVLVAGGVRTLDAGCGNGALTFYCASIGNEALGISNDARAMEKAQRRAAALRLPSARFLALDFHELDQAPADLGFFDQILFLDTFYKMAEPIQPALRGLALRLRPGGKMLLCAGYDKRRPVFASASARDLWGTGQRSHRQLREGLEACGLRVVDEGYNAGILTQGLANIWFVLEPINRVLAWAVTLPLRPLQLLDGPVTRFLRRPQLDIVVVAMRPQEAPGALS